MKTLFVFILFVYIINNVFSEDAIFPLIINDDVKSLTNINDIKKASIICSDEEYHKQKSFTPFEIAVANGKVDVIKFLLTKGYDPNVDMVFGRPALNWAAYQGDLEIIKILENAGEKYYLSKNSFSNMTTPFHIAAACDHKEIIDYYLSKRINIDTGMPEGENSTMIMISPLSCATGYSREEMVNFLIAKGAKLTPYQNCYMSPLHMAVGIRNEQLVQLLLEKGSDVEGYTTENNKSPFCYAFSQYQAIDFYAPGFSGDRLSGVLSSFCENYNHIESIWKNAIIYPKSINLPISHNNTASIINTLKKYGAKDIISEATSKPDTIFTCADVNIVDYVKKCIDNGIKINSYDSNGETALHHAARYGCIDVMKYLLENGAYIEAQGMANSMRKDLSQTPLQVASSIGQISSIEVLLDNRANINLYDNNFRTPLFYAVSYKKNDAVNLLINKGAKVDIYSYKVGWNNAKLATTPIHVAIENEMYQQAKSMINKITDVNLYDGNGMSLLYMAVMKNNQELIKILIDRGADINNMTRGVNQPLHVACDLETVKLLLNKKADPNLRDEKGMTLLHKVVGDVKKNDILSYLLENGANPNIQDINGNTPLIIALGCKNIEAVKILLSKNSSINFTNSTGDTALSIAIRYGIIDYSNNIFDKTLDKEKIINRIYNDRVPLLSYMVYYNNIQLLEKVVNLKIEVNAKDYNNQTALHWAVKFNKSSDKDINNISKQQLDMIKLLVADKINVNSRDRFGLSPLFYVSSKDVAKLLIANGADIDSRDMNGNPPLHYAVINNNISLAQALLDNGFSPNSKNAKGNTAISLVKNNPPMADLLAKYIK